MIGPPKKYVIQSCPTAAVSVWFFACLQLIIVIICTQQRISSIHTMSSSILFSKSCLIVNHHRQFFIYFCDYLLLNCCCWLYLPRVLIECSSSHRSHIFVLTGGGIMFFFFFILKKEKKVPCHNVKTSTRYVDDRISFHLDRPQFGPVCVQYLAPRRHSTRLKCVREGDLITRLQLIISADGVEMWAVVVDI